MPLHSAVLLLGLMLPSGPQPDAAPPSWVQVCDDSTPASADPVHLDLPDGVPAEEASAPAADSSSPQEPQPNGQEKPPDKAEAKKPPTPEHTGVRALFGGLVEDFKHLPTKDNAYVALGGGAGALLVHPYDETFNVRLRSHYTLVNDIYKPAKLVGESPVQVGAAIVVYVLGRRNNQPKVSHFGMDLIRALIVNEVITDALKFATQRDRPDHSDSLSFPSGHSSTTFATATVIERHLGWRYSVLGYAVASYVASSRLHDNRHWLSDVVFGAAVGTISGRTITQHGRNTWTFAPEAIPGGVAIVAVRTR